MPLRWRQQTAVDEHEDYREIITKMQPSIAVALWISADPAKERAQVMQWAKMLLQALPRLVRCSCA